MEIIFNNKCLEKIYNGVKVSGKPKYNVEVIGCFRRRVKFLTKLSHVSGLAFIGGLNFEALKGDKQGLYSIRINNKYRLEFGIGQNIITLVDIIFIEQLSNHYREELFNLYKTEFMEKYKGKILTKEEARKWGTLHPGDVLGEELEYRGISEKDFARAIHVSPEYLRELIEGRHDVSAIMAIKLENELQIPEDIWMCLQAGYDLDIAHRELKAAIV